MMLTKTEIKQKAKWSYEDYAFLPTDFRCEIIDQSLFMAPSPSIEHQNTSSNLEFLLTLYVRKNKLGLILHAPMDVVLSRTNVVQPDIIFVSKESSSILAVKAIKGSPDLLIEIISPGYVKYDREKKLKLYEKFGVKEYWLIDPRNELVEVLTLENKKYQQYSYGEVKGKVKSKVIKGFEVSLKDIFRRNF